MRRSDLGVRLTAEVVGTFGFFFLGFAGLAAAANHPGSIGSGGIAAGFGLGLALMIFAFGHISGGHYNPAVTAGLAAGREFPVAEVPLYWGAQLVGGLIAALAARGLFSHVGTVLVNAPSGGVSESRAFLLEAIATFLFLLVISSVATDARAPWHGVLAPVAIGGFIFTAAVVIGPASSGSFNPARSLAPALLDGTFDHLWLFLAGPLVGGVLGGLVFGVMRRAELAPGRSDPPAGASPHVIADQPPDRPREGIG